MQKPRGRPRGPGSREGVESAYESHILLGPKGGQMGSVIRHLGDPRSGEIIKSGDITPAVVADHMEVNWLHNPCHPGVPINGDRNKSGYKNLALLRVQMWVRWLHHTWFLVGLRSRETVTSGHVTYAILVVLSIGGGGLFSLGAPPPPSFPIFPVRGLPTHGWVHVFARGA